jgi:hypothetical protein
VDLGHEVEEVDVVGKPAVDVDVDVPSAVQQIGCKAAGGGRSEEQLGEDPAIESLRERTLLLVLVLG